MFLVRVCSLLFIGQRKTAVTYLMSFSNNQEFVVRLAKKIAPQQLNVYTDFDHQQRLDQLHSVSNIHLQTFGNNLHLFLNLIPLLMRSQLIIADNYFPFLGGLVKTKKMQIVQLWHANGAIKAFGFSDPTTEKRGTSAQLRFQRVYNSFDDIIVGSEKMADAFQINYRLDGHQIKRLGYPRTDKFSDENWVTAVQRKFFTAYPNLKGKRLILYAPTYRKDVTFEFAPHFDQLVLPENAVLILRLHPHLQALEETWEKKLPFITAIDPKITTDELLTVTDTLITDYSSILFDFTLLKNAHNIGLFAFDQREFDATVGLQRDFETEFHAILIRNVKQLSNFFANPEDQKQTIAQINQNWNQFNDGQATERTLNYLLERSGSHASQN